MSSDPGVNATIPGIPVGSPDLMSLALANQRLKEAIEIFAGVRGTKDHLQRAVTFQDLINYGLFSGTTKSVTVSPGGGGGVTSGVTSVAAGSGISVSASTGAVTVSAAPGAAATQIQAAGSHGSGTVTATLGAAPTAGNVLLFMVSGYTSGSTNYFTPPAGVTVIAQQSTGNEGVAAFARVAQAGDGTTWAFTSPANDFSVTAIEINGAAELQTNTINFGNNGSSSATNVGPLTPAVQTGHLIYGLFNVENATAAAGGSGWSTVTFLGSGAHAHFVTKRAFAGLPPQVTWTNGSTSQPAMGLTVSVMSAAGAMGPTGPAGPSPVTALTFSGSTVNIQGNVSLPAYISQALTFTAGTRVKLAATVRRRSGHAAGFGVLNSSGQGYLVFISGSGANQSVLLSREDTGSSANFNTSGSSNPNQGWVTFQIVITADPTNGNTVWSAQEGGPYTPLYQDNTYNLTTGNWYAGIYDIAGATSADINSASYIQGALP